MTVQYGLETDAANAVTETELVAGITAITYDPTIESNFIQTIQGAARVSYVAQSSIDRLQVEEVGSSGTGYTQTPLASGTGDLMAFQLARAIEQSYGTLEYQAINGTKTESTSASVPALMGGVLKSISTATVDGSTGDLTKEMLDELMLEMQTAGAMFEKPTIFCNGFQKMQLSKIFGYQPASTTVGGVADERLVTDFGVWEIVVSRRVPTDDILFADMQNIAIISQPVPGKKYMPDGLFLYEEKSQAGAAEGGMIYGRLSVDYGSEKLHGSITNLSTS